LTITANDNQPRPALAAQAVLQHLPPQEQFRLLAQMEQAPQFRKDREVQEALRDYREMLERQVRQHSMKPLD
jgi:hypothetical protein